MDTQQHAESRANYLSRDQYLDDKAAARLLSLSRSYLRQLRVAGGGPRYSKLSVRAVRYKVGDLLDWANSKGAASTSQAA